MVDKVSNLFQRATSHGRSPNNKHSISSVSSYSANMFRIDVSDPSTLGILGDDHYEMGDDGNERLYERMRKLGSKMMTLRDVIPLK